MTYIPTPNHYIPSAYWIKHNEIYPVYTQHIEFIYKYIELFPITKGEYFEIFQKYHEPLGFEGYARREIILKCMSAGWIRIRWKEKNCVWVIEYTGASVEQDNQIQNWIKYIVDLEKNLKQKTSKYLEIHIINPDSPEGEVIQLIQSDFETFLFSQRKSFSSQ